MKTRALMGIVCCLLSLPLEAAVEKHVRIIIDSSISMRGTASEPANDPSGNALIASLMFYDLARYDLGPDGSFKVRSFDTSIGPPCPNSAPRTVADNWKVPAGSRDLFVQAILATPYNAPCTYFFPYLEAAARDLEMTRSGDDVKRVEILITDGLTETRTRDEEARLLRELAPRLKASGIELYIIAFGKTAAANEAFFQDIFRFGQPDGVAGEIFAHDPSGNDLVESMLRIFQSSFSYTSETVTGDRLNLEGGLSPRHVAVLARYQPPHISKFEVTPPSGGAGASLKGELASAAGSEIRDAVPRGSGRPISYGVQWVVRPVAGEYRFKEAGAVPSTLAILRPTNLRAQVRASGRSPTDLAMLDVPMRLNVVVSAVDAVKPDPGDVNVQFAVYAIRKAGAEKETYEYIAPEGWIGPTISGKEVPDGREYEIQPTFQNSSVFQKPPADGKPYYDGYVAVRVQKFGNTVAMLPGLHAVRIYPMLALRPSPLKSSAAKGSNRTLSGGETGCAEFEFAVTGRLQDTTFNLSAQVDRALLRGPLSNGQLLLDGRPLSAWQNGIKLNRNAVLQRHTACLTVGRKSYGGKNLELPFRFAIWQSDDDPYKDLDVVTPFTLTADVTAATWLDVWSPGLWLLAALAVVALLLLLLSRLRLPEDLMVATRTGGDAGLALQPLGEVNLARKWFGVTMARPVLSGAGNQELGTVVPVTDRLYCFRPAKNIGQLLEFVEGQWRPLQPDPFSGLLINVHQKYQVNGLDGSRHHFRLEYDSDKAPGRV